MVSGGGGSLGGLAPGSRVAGYLLEEQVGAGGMAVVFRAVDERLGRQVALKVLAPALASDEEFRRRFIRESRAAAAVDDPHIVPVYEAGEADGVLFIAMRYVAGGDVHALLYREGPLPPDRVAAIISPVASALDAAHAAGLVHRDVKPTNMLLDARPERPDHVYLSDFGLSQGMLSSATLTGLGMFLGTPRLRRAGADRGQAGERAGRPVRAGVRGFRDAHRAGAVPARRGQGGDLVTPVGAAPAADLPATGAADRGRPGVRPGPGQESRGPLPAVRGFRRGAARGTRPGPVRSPRDPRGGTARGGHPGRAGPDGRGVRRRRPYRRTAHAGAVRPGPRHRAAGPATGSGGATAAGEPGGPWGPGPRPGPAPDRPRRGAGSRPGPRSPRSWSSIW